MSWLENLRYLKSLCETFSRKVLDDNGKKNIGDATAAGLETHVIRSYDDVGLHGGKDDCEWCKKREGDWSYKEAIQKGIFERHPGCECTIDHVTAKGTKRQTNWRFNTWEDVTDYDTIERRKQYGLKDSPLFRLVHFKTGGLDAREYALQKSVEESLFPTIRIEDPAEFKIASSAIMQWLPVDTPEGEVKEKAVGNYTYMIYCTGGKGFRFIGREPIPDAITGLYERIPYKK